MAEDANKVVHLSLVVRVYDEEKLRTYARERYRAAWASDLEEEQGDGLDAAVYEALVASNHDLVSPLEYGCEILTHGATVGEAW